MTRRSRTRCIVAAVLAAFIAAWVLPAQACAGAVAAHASCPDCPSPCCPHACCPDLATACAASMLPATVPAPSFHKIVSASALLSHHAPRFHAATIAVSPRTRPPTRPAFASLNIRYCRSLE